MNAKACLSALALVVCSSDADGAVISRDWRAPGDGLLTYDTVSGREWLDISETQLSLFPGQTRNERFLAVIAETRDGGRFEGFLPASRDDVLGLAVSAGIDITTWSSINHVPAGALADLLSVSYQDQYGRQVSGVFYDPDPNRLLIIGYRNTDRRFSGVVEYQDFSSAHGVWLYRTVPEASALVLGLLSSSIGLLAAWRRGRSGCGYLGLPSHGLDHESAKTRKSKR